jgi:hypothetical protein
MAKRAKKGPQSGAPTLNLVVNGSNGSAATSEEEAEEAAAIDEMEDGQLFRAMDEVRHVEGAKAEVYRVAPAEKVGHCRSYPVSVFSLEKVATDYGAGKYRVKFKGPGDKYIKGGGTFDIAEGLNAAAAPGAGGSAVEQVLALFKAERERDEADRLKKNDKYLQWATLLVPLVAPKLLDMIGGSKGLGPRDLIGMMKDMKEMQAPAADLNTQFQTVLSVLQGAKELVGDDGGKPSTGATLVDLLRDFIQSPAAGALVSAIPGMGSPRSPSPLSFPSAGPPALQPATAAQPGPAASSGSAPNTAPASTNPDMLQQLQWLRGTLTQLMVQAQKPGSSPRLYGEVVLDNLPPFIDPAALLERLKRDDWLQQLSQVDARVGQHQEWFQRFRDYAVKSLTRKLAKAAEPAPPEAPAEQPLPGPNEPMQDEAGHFE